MNLSRSLDDKNYMGLITLRSYKEIGKNFSLLNNSVWVGGQSTSNNIFNLK